MARSTGLKPFRAIPSHLRPQKSRLSHQIPPETTEETVVVGSVRSIAFGREEGRYHPGITTGIQLDMYLKDHDRQGGCI